MLQTLPLVDTGCATTPASNDEKDVCASGLMGIARGLLVEHGLPLANDAEPVGFDIVSEQLGELSIELNAGNEGASFSNVAFRAAGAGLLQCCGALLQRGYTVTLIASPRTLALYVRP